jgi:hypothetical protein
MEKKLRCNEDWMMKQKDCLIFRRILDNLQMTLFKIAVFGHTNQNGRALCVLMHWQYLGQDRHHSPDIPILLLIRYWRIINFIFITHHNVPSHHARLAHRNYFEVICLK